MMYCLLELIIIIMGILDVPTTIFVLPATNINETEAPDQSMTLLTDFNVKLPWNAFGHNLRCYLYDYVYIHSFVWENNLIRLFGSIMGLHWRELE